MTEHAKSHYLNQCWPSTVRHICGTKGRSVKPLAPGRCGSNFKSVIFKHKKQIKFMSSFPEIALMWMPQNSIDKSTLVQVMAWCHQAPSHYLSQCWPRSVWLYGITMLTHWDLKEMPPALWQTQCSNAFSSLNIIIFSFKFHWNLFLRVQLTISTYL